MTVHTRVCAQEMNKFQFMWHCNDANLPYVNGLSFTIQALKSSFCMCIAVSPSSGNELYRSVVFIVHPTGASSSGQSHMHTQTHAPTHKTHTITLSRTNTFTHTQIDKHNTQMFYTQTLLHKHTHTNTHTHRHAYHTHPCIDIRTCMCLHSCAESLIPSLLATPAASAPLTDPTVRQEVTPSLRQGGNTHPSASHLAATASSISSQLNLPRFPSTALVPFNLPDEELHSITSRSSMVFSPVYHPAVFPASVQAVSHPPQPAPDSEPEPKPSGVFHLCTELRTLACESD